MGTHTISTHVPKLHRSDKDQSRSEKLKYQKPQRPTTQTTEPTQDNNQDTM